MTLGSQARQALAGPGTTLPVARAGVPARPGLYAVHGGAATWQQLGLGRPPDGRPLCVGKAERSLAGRDIRQHFGTGMTGSSTLRRSLAALLRTRLGLSAMARNPARPGHFANYALAQPGDACLTAWMEAQLRLAIWVPDDPVDLGAVERELLRHWQPPLNLAGVSTPWTAKLQAARRVMAEEARRSAATNPGV
jgi:GIY-YIG catalytic domain